MNYSRERFALDLRKESVESVVRSHLKGIKQPPGRKPNDRLVALSEWYNSLDEEQQELLRTLMEYTAEAALFSTLGVFDGASLIGEDLRNADIRLTIEKDGETLLLSSSEHGVGCEDDLHDLMFPLGP